MESISLTVEEAAGNSNPLNRVYFLNGSRIARDNGEGLTREMRANGSFRDVTENARAGGGGLCRFHYVGQAPDVMAKAARESGVGLLKTRGGR